MELVRDSRNKMSPNIDKINRMMPTKSILLMSNAVLPVEGRTNIASKKHPSSTIVHRKRSGST